MLPHYYTYALCKALWVVEDGITGQLLIRWWAEAGTSDKGDKEMKDDCLRSSETQTEAENQSVWCKGGERATVRDGFVGPVHRTESWFVRAAGFLSRYALIRLTEIDSSVFYLFHISFLLQVHALFTGLLSFSQGSPLSSHVLMSRDNRCLSFLIDPAATRRWGCTLWQTIISQE